MLKLKRVFASGFKAVDHFAMDLEPSLTLLLGMNGAGKSSILQLFAFARHMAAGTPSRFFEERGWDRKDLRFRSPGNRASIIRVVAIFESEKLGRVRWLMRWGLNTGRLQREMVDLRRPESAGRIILMEFNRQSGGRVGSERLPPLTLEGSLLSAIQERGKDHEIDRVLVELFAWLTRIQSLELLSPSAMKGSTRLSAGDMGLRGDRLAGFLAALGTEQRARVASRVGLFYRLDHLDTIRKRAGWIDLVLSERFKNFGTVQSAQMSDGFMRMLALCAVPELPEASLVLLDEVEDGIEPHVLGPLMKLVVRETKAQIVATSHSPTLANVVDIGGLRLVSRTDEGRSVAVKLDTLPAFQLGSEYLGPGERWANTELSVLERQAIRSTANQESDEL